jgi:hypothetical protein
LLGVGYCKFADALFVSSVIAISVPFAAVI